MTAVGAESFSYGIHGRPTSQEARYPLATRTKYLPTFCPWNASGNAIQVVYDSLLVSHVVLGCDTGSQAPTNHSIKRM